MNTVTAQTWLKHSQVLCLYENFMFFRKIKSKLITYPIQTNWKEFLWDEERKRTIAAKGQVQYWLSIWFKNTGMHGRKTENI